MNASEEAKLLEARTFWALDKYADSVGISLNDLLNGFSEGGQQLGGPAADQLRSCAYIVWSYRRDSEAGMCPTLSDLVDWARFYGYLAGALQIQDFDNQFDPVLNGKKGLEKRHAPMRHLKSWAIAKFRAGSWPSANAAALALENEVIGYGRTINASLSPTNAKRTIAEWFRKSV